jgi:hypothetical protein
MTSLPITIRPATPRDLPGLRRLTTYLALEQPAATLDPTGPVLESLRSMAPTPHRPRVLVATSDAGILACAALRVGGAEHRWHIDALGAATGVYDVEPIWAELIARGVVLAGLRGVKRLYARAPIDSAAARSTRVVGFSPFARETLYVADAPRPLGSGGPARAQVPSDTWGVHHLSIRSVPAPVQVAEAATSHHWDLPRRRSRIAVDGVVVEQGHDVVAYARISQRGARAVFDLLGQPGEMDAVEAALDAALIRVIASATRPQVACAVPEYQGELGRLLEARGFRAVGQQDVLVKYTAARATAPHLVEQVTMPDAVRVRLVKPKPKRAPSFLATTQDDAAATREG